VYISNYQGSTGWITVGGTSAGAPQWAAAMALVNSARAPSLSSADAAIYSTAASAYSTNFRDVTVGNNGAYTATALYDFVTGLGSPLAPQLIPALRSSN
jgi:subtilase family serine protease